MTTMMRMIISSRMNRTAAPMIARSRLSGKALTDNAANSTQTYTAVSEHFTDHRFNTNLSPTININYYGFLCDCPG